MTGLEDNEPKTIVISRLQDFVQVLSPEHSGYARRLYAGYTNLVFKQSVIGADETGTCYSPPMVHLR